MTWSAIIVRPYSQASDALSGAFGNAGSALKVRPRRYFLPRQTRHSKKRFFNKMASYDVASNIV